MDLKNITRRNNIGFMAEDMLLIFEDWKTYKKILNLEEYEKWTYYDKIKNFKNSDDFAQAIERFALRNIDITL